MDHTLKYSVDGTPKRPQTLCGLSTSQCLLGHRESDESCVVEVECVCKQDNAGLTKAYGARSPRSARRGNLQGGRNLRARRLKQQGESIGVMKIRFVGRMAKRPIREPIARLDDRREPDTKGSTRVDDREAVEPDKSVELKPTASRAHCNVRLHHFVRDRTAVAIAAEGVDGPLPRRGEVELVVRRLPFHRDEGFEAGVLPELCSEARHAWRRGPDPGNISVEAEGYLEFGACRSAYEHLNGAHCLRARQRMALEIDPVFDGHNRLGGRSGIALQPDCSQQSLLAPTFLLSNLSAVHKFIADAAVSRAPPPYCVAYPV
jgi:hypothetical protein